MRKNIFLPRACALVILCLALVWASAGYMPIKASPVYYTHIEDSEPEEEPADSEATEDPSGEEPEDEYWEPEEQEPESDTDYDEPLPNEPEQEDGEEQTEPEEDETLEFDEEAGDGELYIDPALFALASYDLTGAVYLDGVNGDDNNSGGIYDPVQSYAAAKSISSLIVIVDTVTIPAGHTETWQDATILRGTPGLLVEVQGFLGLSGVLLDGQNQLSGEATTDTMIQVTGSGHSEGGNTEGILFIQNSTLQNNTNEGVVTPHPSDSASILADASPGHGGAVRSVHGSVLMASGTVQGNSALHGFGGGFYAASAQTPAVHSTLTLNGSAAQNTVTAAADSALYAIHFYDNYAVAGGGLYAGDYAKTDISYSEFADNVAYDPYIAAHGEDGINDECNVGAGTGGGIRISPSSQVKRINYNYIHHNSAIGYGGGLFVRASNDARGITGGMGELTGNRIAYNTSGFDGGGFYLRIDGSSTDTVSYTRNIFEYNQAGQDGGGAYIDFNSTTKSFRNEYTNNYSALYGGGIFITSSETQEINGSSVIFTGDRDKYLYNTAELDGGGIYLENGLINLKGDASSGTNWDSLSLIQGNTAANGSGGGIYLHGGRIMMVSSVVGALKPDETGATTEGNTAYLDGGGIYVHSGTINVQGTTDPSRFYNNVALTGSGGGAYMDVRIAYMNLNGVYAGDAINSVHFYYNQAARDGGGMYLSVSNEGRISNFMILEFHGNSAGERGGGLYWDYSQSEHNLVTSNCAFTNNTAKEGGGIYLTGTERLQMTTDTISGNAAHRGGGLYIAGCSFLMQEYRNFSGATISNNTAGPLSGLPDDENAAYHGGGIYIEGGSSLLSISTGTVSNNYAAGDGGGIYALGASLEITSAPTEKNILTFSGNEALGNGGGLYFDKGVLSLDTARFEGNTAGQDGGGLYLRIGLEQDDYFENTAGLSENLQNVRLEGNYAAHNGGGAYVDILPQGISNAITGNTITGNTAGQDGGGAYINYDGNGKRVFGNTVTGNTAIRNGGGFYIAREDLRFYFGLSTDKIEDNEAGQDGGGIYLENCFFKVVLSDEIAAVSGGDVFNLPAVYVPSVSGNRAGNNGGGIYADGSSRVWLQYGSYTNNTAGGHGGGIYQDYTRSGFGQDEAILQAEIEANPAIVGVEGEPYGKTSEFLGELARIEHAAFTGNSTAGDGGGLHIVNQQHQYLHVVNSRFDNNTACQSYRWTVDSAAAGGYSYYYTNQIDVQCHTTEGGNLTNAFNNHDINCSPILKLRKVDEAALENGEVVALSGAEFQLYACTNSSHNHRDEIDSINLTDHCWEIFGSETLTTTERLADGSEADYGILEITNLNDQYSYLLVETRAPEGYSLSPGRWLLVPQEDMTVQVYASSHGRTPGILAADQRIDPEVLYWLPNTKALAMPATGGEGTYPYALTGLVLLAAGAFAILRRRKAKQ